MCTCEIICVYMWVRFACECEITCVYMWVLASSVCTCELDLRANLSKSDKKVLCVYMWVGFACADECLTLSGCMHGSIASILQHHLGWNNNNICQGTPGPGAYNIYNSLSGRACSFGFGPKLPKAKATALCFWLYSICKRNAIRKETRSWLSTLQDRLAVPGPGKWGPEIQNRHVGFVTSSFTYFMPLDSSSWQLDLEVWRSQQWFEVQKAPFENPKAVFFLTLWWQIMMQEDAKHVVWHF